MNEYLTIKEVAEKTGVSQQYIYKQLNNKFNCYLKVVEKKKYLHSNVLREFDSTKVEQPFNQNLTKVEQQVEKGKVLFNEGFEDFNSTKVEQPFNHDSTKVEQQEKTLIETLNETIRTLTKQLEIKDKQLEQANELNSTLTRLIDQQQQLQAGVMKGNQLIEQQEKTFKKENFFMKIFKITK